MIRHCQGICALILLLAAGPLAAADQPDSTSVRKMTIKGYPYAYYTPETELAFGVGGIVTFYTGEGLILRPSKLAVFGYYSTNDQYKISLNPEVYFAGNEIFSGLDINFGHFVDKFFGVGNDTPDLGTEDFVTDRFGIEFNVEAPPIFFVSDRSGLVYDFENSRIIDRRDNPYLQTGTLPGSEGGVISGVGGTWVWDSRDHSFWPNSGNLHRVKAIFYSRSVGSDYTYSIFEVDMRHYQTLAPGQVVAIQLYVNTSSGTVPFHKLPGLGGQGSMRGYYEGRYRGKAAVTAQTEFRKNISGRLGFVAFAAIGEVAPDLTRMRMDELKFAAGGGLRFLFNKEEKVNVRIDMGFGKGSSGVYFGIEEAF